MSNWATKSHLSFTASNKLIDDGLFNPSVHLSYYACVQFVYHILHDFFGEDIETIEAGSKAVSNTLGTHQWLRKYIYDSIKTRDKRAAVKIRNEMGDLCNYRVGADYHYNLVEKDKAAECLDLSNKIVAYLKNYYNL